MKKIIYILLILSCNSTKLIFESCIELHGLKIEIPKGVISIDRIQGSHECEIQYHYLDGSVFYFLTDYNTLNYNEMRNNGVYYAWFKCYMSNDIIMFQGLASTGRYWKDFQANQIVVGYTNVPKNNLKKFDNAIRRIMD